MDWAGLLRAGLRGAGLSPSEFWRLTPLELLILLGRESGQAPLGRKRLEEMAKAFPNKDEGNSDG